MEISVTTILYRGPRTAQIFLGYRGSQVRSWKQHISEKNAMDLLEETGLLGTKPVDTPLDPNIKLVADQTELLSNASR